MLTTAGFQVPVIPLFEMAGNSGAVEPAQIVAGITGKVGVTFGVTFTVTVTGIAQSPAAGVKVYVPFTVLLTVAGFHDPPMPLSDVAGSVGAVAPEQIVAGNAAKTGVSIVDIVTLSVVVVPH